MVSSKSKKWLLAGGALLLLYFLMGRAGGLGLFSGWPGGTGREEEEEDPYAYEDYSAWADRNKLLLDPNLVGGQSESSTGGPLGPQDVNVHYYYHIIREGGGEGTTPTGPRKETTESPFKWTSGFGLKEGGNIFEDIQNKIAETLNIRKEAVPVLESATGLVLGGALLRRYLSGLERRGGGGAVEAAGRTFAEKFGGGAGEVAERTAVREGESLISKTGTREVGAKLLGLGRRALKYLPRMGKGLLFGTSGMVLWTLFDPAIMGVAGGGEGAGQITVSPKEAVKLGPGKKPTVKSILLSEKPIVTPESKTQVKSGLITGAERTMARLARTETLPEVRL
ncbi:MAG: hypothetical protein DRP11_05375 [Candidatus Aenigmatarchaeota archaeon]|nr:MAG: hypothetical protein DRP11_05375 [Candidatus Aenigmarchaeota archaeon]